MQTPGRAYVLSAAIALAAMAMRVGWIDRQVVGYFAAVTLSVAAGLMTFLLLLTLLVGVPLLIVIAIVKRLLELVPAKLTEEPPT